MRTFLLNSKEIVTCYKKITIAAMFLQLTSIAFSYTRSELENLSKETLINIILDLQGNSIEECRTFNPDSGETGKFFGIVRHSGYADDGTLKWPNGSVFMKRRAGYNDDRTFYFPNGNTMKENLDITKMEPPIGQIANINNEEEWIQ